MTNKAKKKRKRKLKLQQREQLAAEREQRKKIRHNTAVSQEKHRPDWQPLTPDEDGIVADRRIMPRDERDRRDGVAEAAQQTFQVGLDDAQWRAMAAETPFQLGIVVEVSRGLCRVALGDEVIVAVGDRALLRSLANDRGLIEGVLPRRSGMALHLNNVAMWPPSAN